MENLGLGLDDGRNIQQVAAAQSPGDSRRLSIQRCIQSLVHASQCRNANCSLASCQKMKRVVKHYKGCKGKTNGGCTVCKQLIALCCYHAKYCQENKCPVWFCQNIKQRLRMRQPGLGHISVNPLQSGAVSKQALQELLQALRSPRSPLQYQKVLSILHANPQLLVAFVKQRAARYANPNPQRLPGEPGIPQGQPGLQLPAMPIHQPAAMPVQPAAMPVQQPAAMPVQQQVHFYPAMQNMNPMQVGVQRARLPQQQPQQQLQLPMGG